MRKRTLLYSVTGTVGCLVSQQAYAAVSFSYVADSTSYTAATGSTVAVNLYLAETLTSPSTDIITPDGGVDAAGAAVNVSNTTGGTAASVGAGSYTAASPFNAPISNSIYYNQGAGNNLEFDELTSPGDEAFPTAGKIFLGTLNIKVGTGTTSYSLTSLKDDTINNSNSALGQTDGNTATFNPAMDLDAGGSGFTGADAAAPFTFTVAPTAVPEPASVALLGLGTLGLLGRRRKRD